MPLGPWELPPRRTDAIAQSEFLLSGTDPFLGRCWKNSMPTRDGSPTQDEELVPQGGILEQQIAPRFQGAHGEANHGM